MQPDRKTQVAIRQVMAPVNACTNIPVLLKKPLPYLKI
jgi:hypothetical protein